MIYFNISLLHANKIGFIEDFSLSADKEKALQQLIPGTSDYYYYYCLYYQHVKEFAKADTLLKQWIKREGYTSKVKEILNRQALFKYNDTPSDSLHYIQNEMNLSFDHQKEIDSRQNKHASRLNQKEISINNLKKEALSRYRDLSGFEDAGLDILNPNQLNSDQLRHYLKRLKRPDIKGLSKLVIKDLEAPYSSGFGSYRIHALMFKNQLDECLKFAPEFIDHTNFIEEYIQKLAPPDHISLRYHMDEKKAYLSRLWHFVGQLNPSNDSLKAHVLFHLLDFNRRQGNYRQDLFLEYLKLPRNMHYINKKNFNHHHPIDLNADYKKYTHLPPIISEEALITDYLTHFFRTKDATYDPFNRYLDTLWLQDIFVETKIVNMQGDMEEWFSLISEHQFQAIKDRVDIDFALTNQQLFDVDDPVSLQIYIKNVNTLIVKIFEINTLNYYSRFYKEPDTRINLDGLSPTHEKIFTYDAPPFLRSLQTINFPEINNPGIFVIEFIGNGKSSRALIRKGNLFFVEKIGAAGHEFKIFNEKNQRISDAVIKFDGHEYKADHQGIIIVPFSTHPKYQSVIIQNKNFCSLSGFDHFSEDYTLHVGFYVDRESLLPQMTAKVLIRPDLRLNNHPISLSLLKEISLNIKSIDMDGVSASKRIPDFKVFEDQESVYEFQVPENLSSLHFELSAKIDNISKQTTDSLTDHADFHLNNIDQTPHFENILLHHENNTYTLEILGKNGEPRIHRAVKIELKHKFFRRKVVRHFQTDKNGCIHLGNLKNITYVKASCTDNYTYVWNLILSKTAYPDHINCHVSDTIHLPYAQNDLWQCALFEKRGSTWLSDQSHLITYINGHIQIKGLRPGNYDLFIKSIDAHISICVDEGIWQDNIILSDHSTLMTTNNHLPFIGNIDINDKNVVIHIGNWTEFTRIHVLATRFLPAYSVYQNMLLPEMIVDHRIQQIKPVSYYISGRNIGDEYRYILDRKYADKYPGNMLSKPGLLLNPWRIRKTDTDKEKLRPDEQYDSKKPFPEMMIENIADLDNDLTDEIVMGDRYSTINFLNKTSQMLFNLKPEKNGTITLKRDALNAFRHIHVLLVDPLNTVYRETSLPKTTVIKKDLRLQNSFNLNSHFTEQKRISLLKTSDSLIMKDLTTSRFEIYDSIEKVFGLLRTISNNTLLSEFEFIMQWPELSDQDRQKYYSEKSCHELNFFLYHKDRTFFNDVIRSYIINKKDKTFMDHYLLGDDLASYTDLYYFSHLNIAEKIILARSDSTKPLQMMRYVNDLFDMIPHDMQTYNHLYDIALKSKSLDTRYDVGSNQRSEIDEPEPHAIVYSSDIDDLKAFASPKKEVRSRKMYYKSRKKERSQTRPFYKKLDKTSEWAENNYYKCLKNKQNDELITINAFWNDYANNEFKTPFLSKNVIYANTNFSEIMLALSVMDLPFHAEKHEMIQKDTMLSIKAASPIIIFHQEIMQGELLETNTSILVNQNFFRLDDRYVYINNERMDKFVDKEFLFGIPYGSQVVLSNPTSSKQKLHIMYQIPEGAIPVNKGKYTESLALTLDPFSTQSFEYAFYFPETGSFSGYPIQVSKNEKCIASTKPRSFTVLGKLSKIDTQSWKYISLHGNNKEVLQYLKNNNLNRLDLKRIAFRMKNKSFFQQVIALLKSRHFFHALLWSYGIYHHEQTVISEYLAQSHFANHCGMYIESPLLTLHPISRNMYEHLEYAPFVNARVHSIGKKQSLLNDQFFHQYTQFLKYLSYRPSMSANDMLAATIYLLTQDRVTQAIDFFNRIDQKDIASKIQYDYIHAYILMYQEKPSEAETVIAPYLNYPVLRWQKLFLAVSSQLNDIKGKVPQVIDAHDRNQLQTQLAASETNFDFKIIDREIHISYQNLIHCQINFYPMDIELLFSRNPFVQKQSKEFMIIQPDETTDISLPADQTAYKIALPEKYHNSNLIIEISAQGKNQSHVCYANSLHLQVMENYGQLRLSHQTKHMPLSKAYVKVYAKLKNNVIQFHKDGYTDLRGFFDYASLNTDDLDTIEKFAILVIDENYGAVTRGAEVPKR